MREQARRLFGADILFSEDRGRSLLGDRRQRVYRMPVSQAYELWWDYDETEVSRPSGATEFAYRVRLYSQF